MKVFNNVRGLLAVLAISGVLFLSLGDRALSKKPSPPPPPQEPDWVYSQDEGGWLDRNTGLVWGENAQDLFQSLDPDADVYVLGSRDFAEEVVIPAYQDETGFDDWRLPTRDELTDAASKNYTNYAFPNGVNPWTYQVVTWTSGGNARWGYYGDLVTGETRRTLQAGSFLNVTPVRRASTP